MARIRTVKPDLFRHVGLSKAEKQSRLPLRLAFIGLFCCSDREGRFRWQPECLKLDILPYDDVDFSHVLDALQTAGFVKQYYVNGESYGCIPSWHKHQVTNSRETKSVIPVLQLENTVKNKAETLLQHHEHSNNYRLMHAQAVTTLDVHANNGLEPTCVALHVHAHAKQPEQYTTDFSETMDAVTHMHAQATHANADHACDMFDSARVRMPTHANASSHQSDHADHGFVKVEQSCVAMPVHACGEGEGEREEEREGEIKNKTQDMLGDASLNEALLSVERDLQTWDSIDHGCNIRQQSKLINQQAREILNFLNIKANRDFRPVDGNLKFIVARLKAGASVLQCRQVIVKKTRDWIHDERMSQYLRPATLFNVVKFEQYVGELVLPRSHQEVGNENH